jgi:hypothetical protein
MAIDRVVAVLRRELEEAYASLRARLARLSDDEFFWEPVPNCWTVRKRASGLWAADYPDPPHPDPAPVTTIGWRLVHLAECKLMYHEYAFGAAKLTWPEIDSAHTATTAIDSLERGQQLLLADLGGLGDADLDREVKTNWGELWPARRIFWTMTSHDLHHGGEIGVLRDLYRERGR